MKPKYKELDSKELFKMYSDTRSDDVRDELFERHLFIAEILSKKYVNKGIEYEDIYQVASLGLLYAIQRYDLSKGFEFSSYATPTIIGEIKKHFRDKGWSIRVPRRIQELSKKVNKTKQTLNQKYERVPTISEIAEYLSVTDEEVIEAMEASKVYVPKSLDIYYESGSDDKEIQLIDIVGEDDKLFDFVDNKDFILKVMEKLTSVEKKIIKDRFFNEKTQIHVANELGVSQMTVSRMEKKIIKRFREEFEKIKEI